MIRLFCYLLLLTQAASCARHLNTVSSNDEDKIKFDLSSIDSDGLSGDIGGKVSIDYEFCIPKTISCLKEIKRIHSEIKILQESSGRIGCNQEQYLCLGNTDHPEYRKILYEIAALPYVKRIERAYFE